MPKVVLPTSLFHTKKPRARLPALPSRRLGSSMRLRSSARNTNMSRSPAKSVVLSLLTATDLPNSPGTRKPSPDTPSPNALTKAVVTSWFQMRP